MIMNKTTSSWLGVSVLVLGAVTAVLLQPSVASEQKVPPALVSKGSVATVNAVATTPSMPVAGEVMAHSCAACHGTEGRLGDEFFMPLAGMPESQFVRTMQDFRQDKRPSTLMGHVAKGFSDAELKAMAVYFAAVQPEGVQP